MEPADEDGFVTKRWFFTHQLAKRREYRALAKALSEWRVRAGMSQRELSKRLRRPITYANKVEATERRLDPTEVVEWAKACDASTDELLAAVGWR